MNLQVCCKNHTSHSYDEYVSDSYDSDEDEEEEEEEEKVEQEKEEDGGRRRRRKRREGGATLPRLPCSLTSASSSSISMSGFSSSAGMSARRK